MIFHACIALLLSVVPITVAETIRLSGTVTDVNDNAVKGAVVTLYSRDSLATQSDEAGNFELTDQSVGAAIRERERGTNRYPLTGGLPIIISIHDFNGRLLFRRPAGVDRFMTGSVLSILNTTSPGVYLIKERRDNGMNTVFRYVHQGNDSRFDNRFSSTSVKRKHSVHSTKGQTADFSDILVVSADGKQTLRRAVVHVQENDIVIKLMPNGVNHITPGVPVYPQSGGIGDVTTYGSVSDPEFSQGGACNYGSTGIKYYAAINVNQIPGDGAGQWNEGRCCGRCARVQVRTSDGDVRTTVVRIVDKCPDDHCGIDLGGAPAGEIMGEHPGRYSGEWEWVNCDDYDGVSDGPVSIYTKEGSNEWWSLIQVRNGAGGVSEIRIRKADTDSWISLEWATEAENFFTVPDEMLQDEGEWELEVLWDTGSHGTLLLPGSNLALEDTSYQLTVYQ